MVPALVGGAFALLAATATAKGVGSMAIGVVLGLGLWLLTMAFVARKPMRRWVIPTILRGGRATSSANDSTSFGDRRWRLVSGGTQKGAHT